MDNAKKKKLKYKNNKTILSKIGLLTFFTILIKLKKKKVFLFWTKMAPFRVLLQRHVKKGAKKPKKWIFPQKTV